MSAITRQPLKWHGGKHYLAEKIIELMPPRAKNASAPAADDPGWLHYVEPYFGGGAVLFALDPEGISEVVNDIDRWLTNFWRVLQEETAFADFCRVVEGIPCSQVEFLEAMITRYGQLSSIIPKNPQVKDAAAFFVLNRQSRQALGKDFATLAGNRTRRGMNELPSAWLSAIEGLPQIHARLKRIVILNDDAVDVIRQQDGPRTLFYLDPPYMHETRSLTTAYQHEMSYDQHVALVACLTEVKGRFLLSGYHCPLYDEGARRYGWRCVEIEIDNKASGKKQKDKKTECVWMNY